MATYSNLGVELITTGTESGTWGDITNFNYQFFDTSIVGVIDVTISGSNLTSGTAYQLTVADRAGGAANQADGNYRILNIIDAGDIGGDGYIQIEPNDFRGWYLIRNRLSASRNVYFFQGTYNASRDLLSNNGKDIYLYCTGGGTTSYVYAAYDKAQLTEVSATTGSFSGNVTAANLTATSNVGGATASFSGGVTAAAFAGNGSQLTNVDAYLLDGTDSTQFLRTDTTTTKTNGDLVLNNYINIKFGTASRLITDGTYTYFEIENNNNFYIRNSSYVTQFTFSPSTGGFTATGNITAGGQLTAGYVYSTGNLDVAGSQYTTGTITAGVNIAAGVNITAGGSVTATGAVYTSDWFRSYGQGGWYSQTYGGGVHMSDTTWVRVYNNKALHVSNTIASTGNIVAYYSDERLKTNLGNIPDPLEKISKLNGFYFENNDLAKSKGYTDTKKQLGVSAQEVEAVLPEVVGLAPFDMKTLEDGTIVSESGKDYKTVDYAKLVPLLIEGIKELSSEVTMLKQELRFLVDTYVTASSSNEPPLDPEV